jgi:RNA ligase (TIGR02306 family)
MKLASIERITSISPHTNADNLEFARVLGYSCLVPKGKYTSDMLVVLIQPDTVLPDDEWTAVYRKFSPRRVKAVRLRGEWSFGIVESTALLPENTLLAEGMEVSSMLGISKYEAPAPQDLSAKGTLPYYIPKTDEERYQNLDPSTYEGAIVDVTLKIDGQSFTAYYHNGDFGVCGRSFEYRLDHHNNYTAHVERYNLHEKLQAYCERYKVNLALRGESYGQGIQSVQVNPHSTKPKGLAFFSVWLIDEMCVAYKGDEHYVFNVCAEMDLPCVPLLERDVVCTQTLIQRYDEELTTIDNEPFEGVVVVGSNFSFKVINKHYDSRK